MASLNDRYWVPTSGFGAVVARCRRGFRRCGSVCHLDQDDRIADSDRDRGPGLDQTCRGLAHIRRGNVFKRAFCCVFCIESNNDMGKMIHFAVWRGNMEEQSSTCGSSEDWIASRRRQGENIVTVIRCLWEKGIHSL